MYIVRSRSKLALDNPGAAPTEPLFMHHVVGPDECPLQSTLPLAFREREILVKISLKVRGNLTQSLNGSYQ